MCKLILNVILHCKINVGNFNKNLFFFSVVMFKVIVQIKLLVMFNVIRYCVSKMYKNMFVFFVTLVFMWSAFKMLWIKMWFSFCVIQATNCNRKAALRFMGERHFMICTDNEHLKYGRFCRKCCIHALPFSLLERAHT